MGRSMDWTLEENMVNCLILCATPTSRRSGHTPFVQIRAETSGTGAEAVEPDPCCQWRSQEFFRGGQSPDVRPIVPSVYFRAVENWYKAPVKILASLFLSGT